MVNVWVRGGLWSAFTPHCNVRKAKYQLSRSDVQREIRSIRDTFSIETACLALVPQLCQEPQRRVMVDFFVSSLLSCRLCAMSLRMICRSTPRCCQIHFFLGLPLLRLPSTVPCSITLVRSSDLVTCPYHFSFRRFTVARRSSYGPMCIVMVFRTCSLVIRSLQEMLRICRKHLNSSDWILLCSCTVSVKSHMHKRILL